MTTYELAKILEHLQLAFGDSLKTAASGSLSEAALAFREVPDQNLRAFLTTIRRANAPQTVEAGGVASGVIEKIRAIRAGAAPAGEVLDLGKLKNDQLKDVLREFKQPVSGAKPDLVARIRQLCVFVAEDTVDPTEGSGAPTPNPAAVDAGVALYQRLIEDRQLSIPDVRASFSPLREYSKPVLEEVSRRVGFTPAGSREDILNRLLNNLEGIKMSQHRADRILTGTSG